MFVEMDVASDDGEASFRRMIQPFIDKGEIEIHKYVEHGPAGGNPLFKLGVYSGDALRAIAAGYFDGKEA